MKTITDQAKARIYLPRFTGTTLMGGEELAASLLRGCWFYFPSLCWRTEAIKKAGFRADLDIIQDLALVIDLIEAGATMALSDELAFQYRRHDGSVSSAEAMAGKRFAEARRYFVGAAAQMEALGWPKAAKAARRYTASRLHAVTLLPVGAEGALGARREEPGPARFPARAARWSSASRPRRQRPETVTDTAIGSLRGQAVRIAAVVTAYHPDERLLAVVDSVQESCAEIVVVDNTPEGAASVAEKIEDTAAITVLRSGREPRPVPRAEPRRLAPVGGRRGGHLPGPGLGSGPRRGPAPGGALQATRRSASRRRLRGTRSTSASTRPSPAATKTSPTAPSPSPPAC